MIVGKGKRTVLSGASRITCVEVIQFRINFALTVYKTE